MTTLSVASDSRGFWGFYREYARSGVHAATAAGMTLFGLLATYQPAFVVLAVLVYVLPPLYLYLSADRTVTADEGGASGDSESGSVSNAESPPESAASPEPGPGTDATSGATRGEHSDERATAGTRPDAIGDSETVGTTPGWAVAGSPTDEPLYDAVVARGTVFAVGDDGVVLARRDGAWEIVLEHGPTTESNPLWGIDATDDGEHVWFGGDDGVLGQYDVTRGKLTDRSAPRDRTDTWDDVAVVGPAGDEAISLVNGSGEVFRGRNGAGDVTWDEPVKPGSGSSLSGISFRDRTVGYCCDTSQGVFETVDGGESWERIGIDDAGVDFNDLAATPEELLVAGGDGSVFRYDDPGWTKLYAGEETIFAIDLAGRSGTDSASDTDTGVAVGDNGAIYELAGNDWERVDSPIDDTLCGVVKMSDADSPDVAVGDDGTIVERGG